MIARNKYTNLENRTSKVLSVLYNVFRQIMTGKRDRVQRLSNK